VEVLPAALKNLLEWLVSDPEFYGKPVVILHAKEESKFAFESLKEVLRTMSANILEKACVELRWSSNRLTATDILQNEFWRKQLAECASLLLESLKLKADDLEKS